jgi:hypothetical protein
LRFYVYKIQCTWSIYLPFVRLKTWTTSNFELFTSFCCKLWTKKIQIATTSFKIKKIKGGWCIIPIAKQLFLLHHLILMKETINFNLSIKTYKTQKRCGATMLQPTTMTCNYKYLNKGPTIGEIFYINFFSYYVFFMFTIGGSINLDYLSSPLPMGVG